MTAFDKKLPSALIVAAMALVASMSFRSVFDGWAFALAPVLGTLGAATIALIGMRKELRLGEVVGLSFLGYFLIGVVAAGGPPIPSSVVAWTDGVTGGWIRMLDSLPPADSVGSLRALPFTAAWLGTAVGIEIVRRSDTVGLPAIGPLISLGVSILFSTAERTLGVFQGATLAVLFLLLVTLQNERTRTKAGENLRPRPVRIALGAIVLLVVVAVAPALERVLTPESPAGRVELRELRQSPWDPLAVPSPLVEVKGQLVGDVENELLFTVSGPEVSRIRLAALETYDGRVWSVADASRDAVAEFEPAGPALPDESAGLSGAMQVHTFTAEGLHRPWLPVAGVPTRVTIAGSEDDRFALRLNATTGTLAVPSGIRPGTTYTVESHAIPDLAGDDLRSLQIARFPARFKLELLPPSLQNAAADIVEGFDPGWDQVEALQSHLRDGGFYALDDVSPGHSYSRIALFLDQLGPDLPPVGYTEQYGAGAAVLGRAINLPTRAVVGYLLPESRWVDGSADVLRGDVSVWMEVLTEDHGWVAVDVTPDESRQPERQASSKTTRIVASPNPPPPPPTSTTSTTIPLGIDEEVEDQIVEEDQDDDAIVAFDGMPLIVRAGVIGLAIPMLLMALMAAIAVTMKWYLRRRRRSFAEPERRVAGAWYETLDRYRETGIAVDSRSTPSELAAAFTGGPLRSASGALDDLAMQVDRSAFHRDPPTEDRANLAWSIADTAIHEAKGGFSMWRRVMMAVDPRTVIRPSRRGDPSGSKPRWKKVGGHSELRE